MFRGELDGICAGYFGEDKQDTFQIMKNDTAYSGVSLCQNLYGSDNINSLSALRADLDISIQDRTVSIHINKLNIGYDYNIFRNCYPGVCVCVDVPTGHGHSVAETENGAVIRKRNYGSGAMNSAQWLVKPLEYIDKNTPTKKTYSFELPSIEKLPS